METQENKEAEQGCCKKGKCGCGGKALAALALLLVGGLGGYCAAKHCGSKNAAPGVSTPVENPKP